MASFFFVIFVVILSFHTNSFAWELNKNLVSSWNIESESLVKVFETSPNITVAIDGSGDFTTIMKAIQAAPKNSNGPFLIYIKKGIYKEFVQIGVDKKNIVVIGDGMGKTVISGNHSNASGSGTFSSETFGVDGERFMAVNLTIENTAGPEGGQAVALRSNSNHSVYYKCEIKGYQDTLLANVGDHFYRECKISGTVDFIFGNARAVFQNCDILARQNLKGKENAIAAHGRDNPNEATGFTFQFCNVTGDTDLLRAAEPTPTYLGRPWRPFALTVFMQSELSSIIRPEGWLEWEKSKDSTVFYGEFKNTGPGAATANRVKWPGFHAFDDPNLARNFTVSKFIDGDSWLPATGVPFTGGL